MTRPKFWPIQAFFIPILKWRVIQYLDQYCVTTAERHPCCTYVTQLLFLGVITSKKSLRLPVDLTTTMERGEVMLRGKTKGICHILVNTFTEMFIVGQFVRPDILWIRHRTFRLYLTNWRFAFSILTEPSPRVCIFPFGTTLRLLYLDTALYHLNIWTMCVSLKQCRFISTGPSWTIIQG